MTGKSVELWPHSSHHPSVGKAFASLILWLLLSATSQALAEERIGRFCSECVDQASAQRVAESMAPPPGLGSRCDDLITLANGDAVYAQPVAFGGTDASCASRRVFIVNPDTEAVHVFRVRTQGSSSHATPASPSREEQLAIRHLLDARLAWDAMMAELPEHVALPPERPSVRAFRGEGLPVSEECPSGTALDAFLSPSSRPDLESALSLNAELLFLAALDAVPERQFFVSREHGISVRTPDLTLPVAWEPSQTPPVFHHERFSVSEQEAHSDRLVFELELVSSMLGRPAVMAQFRPEKSQVAGMAIEQFEQGATLDPCSAQKVLRAMDERGATFHSPPSDLNPIAFPTNLVLPNWSGPEEICSLPFSIRANGQIHSTHTIKVLCESS